MNTNNAEQPQKVGTSYKFQNVVLTPKTLEMLERCQAEDNDLYAYRQKLMGQALAVLIQAELGTNDPKETRGVVEELAYMQSEYLVLSQENIEEIQELHTFCRCETKGELVTLGKVELTPKAVMELEVLQSPGIIDEHVANLGNAMAQLNIAAENEAIDKADIEGSLLTLSYLVATLNKFRKPQKA